MKAHPGVLLLALLLIAGCSSNAGSSKVAKADYPSVEGDCPIAQDWSFSLPAKFQRRTEDGNLVFWRPGVTVYVVVWDNDQHKSVAERLEWIKGGVSRQAFDRQEEQDGELHRFAYRLTEERDQGPVHGLYGYAIGHSGLVQMAVYFQDERKLDTAREIWRSIAEQ